MQHGTDQQELLETLLHMVEAGSINPAQPTTYGLDDAATALDDLLGRRVVGKVALTT